MRDIYICKSCRCVMYILIVEFRIVFRLFKGRHCGCMNLLGDGNEVVINDGFIGDAES